jgi:hypothetical protein
MRTINEVAAAPETEPHEARVLAAVERVARVEEE